MINSLPEKLKPLLRQVVDKWLPPDSPLDFWTIDHGPSIFDGFCELAPRLLVSGLLDESLPRGYSMLAYLFDWEMHCQCNGWGAFGNIDEADFERVCSFYAELGLAAETESLRVQMAAFRLDPNDSAALNRAVENSLHSLSIDLDRMEHLTQYFCDHAPELLYE